ncbi:hypothetical protein JF634_01670 [Simonsiella muelleri]|mgnify:CR=1 FL=1|jgi:hypothetical protein|uniref:Uncharacterized protein n=1 Tax=Simonsiella muelleri ATCC 29453 TaxID=641147 RepID=V9HLX1_9NEIS|nr:hypothetical protein [Simonsiella muelleri]AUX62152.1 hypothetical protein BWP33_10285 [Simonsiella muelleri ATCC 29453]EFG31329.1 hypothetical protein HMPREF9021_00597 [Simonsiella muelleri ATCC 29453]UBQ54246.1 hypothetical protein JF634_01670 [Simonsiella muelleri]
MSIKHDEERELLQLQCELARLKLAATHRKKLDNQLHENQHTPANQFLQAASSVSSSAWQLALLPKSLKYRGLMILLIVLAQWFSKKRR